MTSSNWPTAHLGELADFRNGINYTKRNFGSGIKVLNVKDFQDRTFVDPQRLDEIDPTGLITEKNLLKPDDIVFVRSNGNRDLIGRSVLIRHSGFTHSAFTIRARFKSPDALPRYYFYLLRSGIMRATLSAHGGGTNISNLNQKILNDLLVPLPPLPQQECIASILSPYDDLIENNNRRIKLLEQIARLMYEEWFVRFRYPGHTRTRMVESELGPIPADWPIKRLAELVNTQYGYTASASEDPIGPKFLRGKDINKTTYIDWADVPYCSIPSNKLSKYQLSAGDVLVIRMADPGKVGIVERDVEAVFASYLVRLTITSSRLSPLYLFHFLLSDRYQGHITGASTGTTRKSASAGVLTDIAVPLPPTDVIRRFEKQIGSVRDLLNSLLEQNRTLRETRDLLLPKLVSGDIDVSDLDLPGEVGAA